MIDRDEQGVRRNIDGTPFFLSDDPRYRNYDIGRGTYGQLLIVQFEKASATKLKIGRYCSFSNQTVILLGGEHRHEFVTSYPFSEIEEEAAEIPGYPVTKGDIAIGNDVWVGWGATIMSGVTIGDGAVVAAQAVVTRDVHPYQIVGGTPAREIRYRFSDRTVQALRRIKWWDWPEEKIKEEWAYLQSDEITEFIQRHDRKEV